MMMRYAIIGAVLAAIGAAWFVLAGRHAPRDGLDLSRSKFSEQGLYEVSIEPESEPIEQGPLHSWIAAVRSADGTPLVDATVVVDGGMPDHGHGLPTAPRASHIGDGHYRIEGVRFNMSGWWELRLTIDGASGEDVVVFNIML
ncbi:MAG: FixH family protein [Rhizobiaceae bacterium]